MTRKANQQCNEKINKINKKYKEKEEKKEFVIKLNWKWKWKGQFEKLHEQEQPKKNNIATTV